MSFEQKYQRCKPMTAKNIGKNRLKRELRSATYEPNGSRETQRRMKQAARVEAKRLGV
ncbi:hypothetical protein BPNPMPFG_002465 [Mesorhizobium sp. AR07]|uniref:hypothetical protein n=1 Tax=Mesorhizobium sp. AR07 TaxID=2865838 RepID=UPI002160A086|nr:hypothetical protein [Mesorhizobium sp. AR07]UVK46757.1 hypothetical protein BPNPMPFG_002465 [Mesorhizobium sp. AR07]